MKPWVTCRIEPQEVSMFQTIEQVVQRLPDNLDEGRLGLHQNSKPVVLSCHIIARALAKVYGLRYQDGYFCGKYQHSWLVMPSGNIVDPYPVGALGGPIMVDGASCSPWPDLYTPCSARRISIGHFSRPWFRNAVRKLIRILRRLGSDYRQA